MKKIEKTYNLKKDDIPCIEYITLERYVCSVEELNKMSDEEYDSFSDRYFIVPEMDRKKFCYMDVEKYAEENEL